MNATHRHFTRGAAMAETAMVVSFTLVLLFGIVQLILVGYLQVAGDAAVFVAAHEYTLGADPNAINTAEANMVPKGIASAIVYTPAPPAPVGSAADALMTQIYGTMGSHSRTGGYTLVRPQNFTAYLNSAQYAGVLQFAQMPINSAAVEGYYLMTNQQMDQFGDSPDDPNGLTGNILNPAYASPFLPQSDAVVANMNTPPLYLPNPIMKICTAPWNGAGGTFNQQCNGAQSWFLGLGATLENSNYAMPSQSIGVNAGQTFETLAGHQRIFSNLVAAFPPLLTNAQLACIQAQFQAHGNTATAAATAACTPFGGAPTVYGMNWTNNLAFPNINVSSSCPAANVSLLYYDALNQWEHGGVANWSPQTMWAGETALGQDAGNDGPQGPCSWHGASFALVYFWDQPNFGNNVGPGLFPPNPTAGISTAGDPGY